ncbi:hypothetical protein RJ641_012377 [Dillenia turbinata]|uniref:Uncharacterized protein n=1 Tax=Dillenia turbinata TaxID=194707 RepID=A0AAN8Z3X9_9MAGN
MTSQDMVPVKIRRTEAMLERWRAYEESEKLEKEVKDSILRIIRDGEKKAMTGAADSFGSDFLGLLRIATHDFDKRKRATDQDMIDECKTFYTSVDYKLPNLDCRSASYSHRVARESEEGGFGNIWPSKSDPRWNWENENWVAKAIKDNAAALIPFNEVHINIIANESLSHYSPVENISREVEKAESQWNALYTRIQDPPFKFPLIRKPKRSPRADGGIHEQTHNRGADEKPKVKRLSQAAVGDGIAMGKATEIGQPCILWRELRSKQNRVPAMTASVEMRSAERTDGPNSS